MCRRLLPLMLLLSIVLPSVSSAMNITRFCEGDGFITKAEWEQAGFNIHVKTIINSSEGRYISITMCSQAMYANGGGEWPHGGSEFEWSDLTFTPNDSQDGKQQPKSGTELQDSLSPEVKTSLTDNIRLAIRRTQPSCSWAAYYMLRRLCSPDNCFRAVTSLFRGMSGYRPLDNG